MTEWTDADKSAFVHIWEDGEPLSKMAKRFDVAINTISARAASLGLEPTKLYMPLVEVKCLCGCERMFKTRDPKGNRISARCKRSEAWQFQNNYHTLRGAL